MEILSVKGLSFTYPKSAQEALSEVSFSVGRGSFCLMTGLSGCGKTTLLRLIKPEIAPTGKMCGTIETVDSIRIGYVSQDPDDQIVTDTVWQELAFGLECLGIDRDAMKKRVCETASYFGLEDKYHASTDTLSGGEKQLLNLAAAMVMRPELLLLDEPTSRLDPIAKDTFLSALFKLVTDFGTTVVIAEHCTESLLSASDKVIVLDAGSVVFDGGARDACKAVKDLPIFETYPAAARLWKLLKDNGDCPINVNEGKRMLEKYSFVQRDGSRPPHSTRDTAVELKKVSFRYERELPDVLKELEIKINSGEIFTLLGANGCGKSTLVNVASGSATPSRGSVWIMGKSIKEYKGSLYDGTLALLPQEPKAVFCSDTVAAELDGDAQLMNRFGLTALADRHPYDLSGGEQQKCALAKVIKGSPKILILDEPTKGMDAATANEICHILTELKSNGTTVLIVSHDVELAAKVSDRCALMFDGSIVSCAPPEEFFEDCYFYSPAAARIARGKLDGVITAEDVVRRVRM